MRRAAKVDDNQAEIVAAFRDCGCSVAVTSAAGDGFPDIVVGLRGRNLLVEIKDGSKPPSERKLTPKQKKFHGEWKGQITVCESVDQVLQIVRGEI